MEDMTCSTCGMEADGWICAACGYESAEEDSDHMHEDSDEGMMVKCSGCGKAEADCDC